jgi:hypothetical protein
MIKNVTFLVFIFALSIVANGSNRFILLSELKTTHYASGATAAYTRYNYDASGNQFLKRIYDGVDTNAARLSTISYTYNSSGNVYQELLMGTSNDTLSIIRYTYLQNRVTSIATLQKSLSVRFKDTLIYTDSLPVRQNRLNSAGLIMFYTTYTYTTGNLVADTLYEPDGLGGFMPTQAHVISRNADGTVASNTHWQYSTDTWFAITTTKMSYLYSHLYAVTTYEQDGVSKKLHDSLSYNYDSNNNRVRQYQFDANRTLVYDIIYTWYDTYPTRISRNIPKMSTSTVARIEKGSIIFSSPFSGNISFIQLNGKTIESSTLTNRLTYTPNKESITKNTIMILKGSNSCIMKITQN